MTEAEHSLVPIEAIAQTILVLRGQRVILDEDLARLYGVTTKRLNEQVRRNADRFPPDFVFQLSDEEARNLKSQNATSSSGHGGRRKLPLAFTEHGALMAATVLTSPRATEMSVYVVRAFVRMWEILASHGELSQKLWELEQRLDKHDEEILAIITALGQLLAPPEIPDRKMGYRLKEEQESYTINRMD